MHEQVKHIQRLLKPFGHKFKLKMVDGVVDIFWIDGPSPAEVELACDGTPVELLRAVSETHYRAAVERILIMRGGTWNPCATWERQLLPDGSWAASQITDQLLQGIIYG